MGEAKRRKSQDQREPNNPSLADVKRAFAAVHKEGQGVWCVELIPPRAPEPSARHWRQPRGRARE